ncbi:hypothetical protein F4825DRAFT_445998 [Nemania diffusa]|nr:hypothetical protein F4825DRAFT_445998 [Nemania diffusa]
MVFYINPSTLNERPGATLWGYPPAQILGEQARFYKIMEDMDRRSGRVIPPTEINSTTTPTSPELKGSHLPKITGPDDVVRLKRALPSIAELGLASPVSSGEQHTPKPAANDGEVITIPPTPCLQHSLLNTPPASWGPTLPPAFFSQAMHDARRSQPRLSDSYSCAHSCGEGKGRKRALETDEEGGIVEYSRPQKALRRSLVDDAKPSDSTMRSPRDDTVEGVEDVDGSEG